MTKSFKDLTPEEQAQAKKLFILLAIVVVIGLVALVWRLS
jgi:hypothetical protein